MNSIALTWLAAVGSLVLCAGGCGGSTTTATAGDLTQLQAQDAAATTLHFTTSTSISQNPAPPLDITVTDAAKVRAVYQATLALPAVPTGVGFNCPADFGVAYHLTFSAGQAVLMQAALEAGGCEFVTIVGTSIELSGGQAGYWSQLAAALGVSESAIYPYLPPAQI